MPTIAVDPDGNEIIFDNGKGQKFTYRKGNFYHSNEKRYNPGKESISKDMYKVLTAYRKIESSGDKQLMSMLKTLEQVIESIILNLVQKVKWKETPILCQGLKQKKRL